MTAKDTQASRSRVRMLEEREYDEGKFPQELLRDGMSTQEKWMFKTIWKLDNKVDWLMRSLIEENATLREIDVREQETSASHDSKISSLEEWKIVLMGKWGVVSIAVVTCVTAVLSSTISLFTEKLFK